MLCTCTTEDDGRGHGAKVPNADDLSTAFDQPCIEFEGTLALGEPLNLEDDGEARYFGSTSGRLDFPEHHGRSVSGSSQRSSVCSFVIGHLRFAALILVSVTICPHLPVIRSN